MGEGVNLAVVHPDQTSMFGARLDQLTDPGPEIGRRGVSVRCYGGEVHPREAGAPDRVREEGVSLGAGCGELSAEGGDREGGLGNEPGAMEQAGLVVERHRRVVEHVGDDAVLSQEELIPQLTVFCRAAARPERGQGRRRRRGYDGGEWGEEAFALESPQGGGRAIQCGPESLERDGVDQHDDHLARALGQAIEPRKAQRRGGQVWRAKPAAEAGREVEDRKTAVGGEYGAGPEVEVWDASEAQRGKEGLGEIGHGRVGLRWSPLYRFPVENIVDRSCPNGVGWAILRGTGALEARSEERRVGKECR